MERIFNTRFLIVSLCTVFFISLVTLISSLFPIERWPLDRFSLNHGNETWTTYYSHENNGTFTVDNDDDGGMTAEAAEDLVHVETAPTKASEWKPKQFDNPEPNIISAIERNIRKEKKDKILLTAVANSGMSEYALNWIASLERTGQDHHFLVFAIDSELTTILQKAGYGDHVVTIPDTWFHKALSSEFSKWLQGGYTPITHAKTLVVERLLYMDVTVWFSDIDLVFVSDAIYSYLLQKLNARGSKTETLFTQETEQRIVNSGFYLMRPTNTNKRILADTIMIQDNEPKVTQQRAINRVLDDMDLSYQTSSVALLELSLFPHGRLYFERNIPKRYGFDPMIVHANYRVGDQKKEALKKADLWFI